VLALLSGGIKLCEDYVAVEWAVITASPQL